MTTSILKSVFVFFVLSISSRSVWARPQEIVTPSTSHDNEFKEVKPDNIEIIAVAAEKKRHEPVTFIEQPSSDGDFLDGSPSPPLKVYAEYSINSDLDFGRSAASESSSTVKASTMAAAAANALKSVNKQFLPANASDMVLADIRTPPKIKSQMQSLYGPGKGEAIPVVLDSNEDGTAALDKVSADNFKYTVHQDDSTAAVTPASGLSTWILLNSDTISTPLSSPHHKKVNRPVLYDVTNLTTTENATVAATGDGKKKVRPTPAAVSTSPLSSVVAGAVAASTTEKNIKSKIDPIVKKPERKPIATIQKVNQTYAKKPSTLKSDVEEIITTTLSSLLQDSKFKNKTPVVMGKIPGTTKSEPNANNTVTTPTTPFVETTVDNGTRLGTPVVTFPHVPSRQRPNSSTSKKPFTVAKPSSSSSSSTKYEQTTTAGSADTAAIVTVEEIAPIAFETTTKKVVSSTVAGGVGKKKKKKNKNKKRRRPSSKKPGKVQSKISDDENTTLSKLPGPLPANRPLSTRIYNYLAREVMPNVGVGLVGLMLTAGLAGLLLYPFGGAVPIRRNYDKNHPPPPYNINDYPPINEVDNAQPEESVLSQVLAGMSNSMNQYSREQPDTVYKNAPKYKPARFDNPTGAFPPHKDSKYTTERGVVNEPIKYSELGDVVSGPHESVKFTSFDINDSIKYPQPSPNYSTIDLTTSGHQSEPVAFHAKNQPQTSSTDGSNGGGGVVKTQHDPVYSTLGEYASYGSFNEPVQNPVYKGESSSSYDYKNHKNDQDVQEFKVSSEMEVVTQPPPPPSSLPDQSNASGSIKTTIKNEQPPSFAALEGIPKNYRTLQTSIRFEDTAASVLPMTQDFVPSDGVFATSVEHGPRNMKLRRRRRRRRRNTQNENELDSILETAAAGDKSSANVTTVAAILAVSESNSTERTVANTSNATNVVAATNDTNYVSVELMSNEIFADDATTIANASTTDNPTSTTGGVDFKMPDKQQTNQNNNGSTSSTNGCENCGGDLSNVEDLPSTISNTNTQPSSSSISLGTIFRKILDFKLRLGMELIRATSEAITSYLGSVQQRMSEALRTIQRGAFRSTNTDSKNKKLITKKREKRYVLFDNVVF